LVTFVEQHLGDVKSFLTKPNIVIRSSPSAVASGQWTARGSENRQFWVLCDTIRIQVDRFSISGWLWFAFESRAPAS